MGRKNHGRRSLRPGRKEEPCPRTGAGLLPSRFARGGALLRLLRLRLRGSSRFLHRRSTGAVDSSNAVGQESSPWAIAEETRRVRRWDPGGIRLTPSGSFIGKRTRYALL